MPLYFRLISRSRNSFDDMTPGGLITLTNKCIKNNTYSGDLLALQDGVKVKDVNTEMELNTKLRLTKPRATNYSKLINTYDIEAISSLPFFEKVNDSNHFNLKTKVSHLEPIGGCKVNIANDEDFTDKDESEDDVYAAICPVWKFRLIFFITCFLIVFFLILYLFALSRLTL